jgi:hypothetical protein
MQAEWVTEDGRKQRADEFDISERRLSFPRCGDQVSHNICMYRRWIEVLDVAMSISAKNAIVPFEKMIKYLFEQPLYVI